MIVDPVLLAALRAVDTPTVCNAIEVVQGRRGFAGYTRSTMLATRPAAPPMVGRARTARIASTAPSVRPPTEARALRLAYFRHMFDAPAHAIAVIEDVDGAGATGAWWGEIHVGIHAAFGLQGAITNGLARDLGEGRDDFPILCGGVGPSHAFVHVVEFGAGATVFGCEVPEGAMVHADEHGMVVIPEEVIPKLLHGLETLHSAEGTILSAVAEGWDDFESFAKSWEAFERART